jgi:hypothetical protein
MDTKSQYILGIVVCEIIIITGIFGEISSISAIGGFGFGYFVARASEEK